MNILGAGLTGCLAGFYFPDSVIHEFKNTPNKHSALLRFRSDEISKLTGIKFKKVKVQKGIFYDNKFVQPDIAICNMYSRKVTGGLAGRSIWNTREAERWIAPNDFHEQMLNKLSKRIVYDSKLDINNCDKPVISTLPINVISNMIGAPAYGRLIGDAKPIYVTTVHIPDCELYQTIYYPSLNNSIYRASLTGDKLIIESVCDIDIYEVQYVLSTFVIDNYEVINFNIKQENGKFLPLPEDERKTAMYTMTKHFDIYSLGRHATWRKIMLDDIPNDLRQIEKMIRNNAYDLMVGKA